MPISIILILWLCVLIVSPQAALAQLPPDLHTPGPRSGQLQIRLQPTEAVRPGDTRLVTFGVPFPRESLRASELSQVRATIAGAEVPLWVDTLTPWRQLTGSETEGDWVRVLRVQLQWRFTEGPTTAIPLTLHWNEGPRTLTRSTRSAVRDGWHLVTDGVTATGGMTFGAAHQVFEPDVYAVLPQPWLGKSGIKSPTLGFAANLSGLRDDPGKLSSDSPEFEKLDRAQVNFFYTIINDDEVNTVVNENNNNPFADPSAFEPWLYDRAMVLFVAYLRGGYFRILREGVRNAEYYRRQLWRADDCSNGACVGSFRLKNRSATDPFHDTKYSYNESLAFLYWLTGDDEALRSIEDVARMHTGDPAVNRSDWTERHIGFKFMAEVVAWEITGKSDYRDRLGRTLAAFRTGQLSPYGGVADGGIWHSIAAHEGIESVQPVTSPWMSALIVDAAMRTAMMGESTHSTPLVEGLARHVCGLGSYRQVLTIGGNLTNNLRIPHYLATLDGAGWPSEFDPISNAEHASEAAAMAAWGAYFRARAGDTSGALELARCAREFAATFGYVVSYWTRPGNLNFDAYRVSPPRKYAWWFKNASGFGWALAAAEGRSAATADVPAVTVEGRVPPVRLIRDRRRLSHSTLTNRR